LGFIGAINIILVTIVTSLIGAVASGARLLLLIAYSSQAEAWLTE
jgi:hypothetical protein